MGVLADAALAANGEVIGIIPRAMIAEERSHHRLTELIPVESMHERKHRMALPFNLHQLQSGKAFRRAPLLLSQIVQRTHRHNQ
jgi:Possible lysine decarboxylase